MSSSLLKLPPELLVHIAALLPIHALLKFSETCRYAHGLANSSMHTLSLGIHPTRVSSIISRLAAAQYPVPKTVKSAFVQSEQYSASHQPSPTTSNGSFALTNELLDDNDPYKVSVLIPDAQAFDYMTLLNFHTALTRSILIRHGSTLRNLDISLWTLDKSIATDISRLAALRTLSIRIEDVPHVRAVPRSHIGRQRIEQREAWTILFEQAVWAPCIAALRIEGGELTTTQLKTLLRKNRWCRELWLCKCSMPGPDFWSFLGSEWEGRTTLRIFGLMRCGKLEETMLDAIGKLTGLQFLTLAGCHGLESEVVEKWNSEVWRIPECVPPQPHARTEDASTFIEVDPAYLGDVEA